MSDKPKSRTLSVRRTADIDEALSHILAESDSANVTEAVGRALSLYADWLRQPVGASIRVTAHTRKKAA
ncbi:hypothetical protein [Streptomyces sp. NPDC056817]|uniref:hypothetical protein n=1 Tax=Streptomyces sp. NPDC056817 TaxID=3345950 RepID=UPI0036A930E3